MGIERNCVIDASDLSPPELGNNRDVKEKLKKQPFLEKKILRRHYKQPFL